MMMHFSIPLICLLDGGYGVFLSSLIVMAFSGQTLIQTPHPQQKRSSDATIPQSLHTSPLTLFLE